MNDCMWIFPEVQDLTNVLSAELGVPNKIAQILINRGFGDVESAHKFIFGTLNDLHDPFLMEGMRKAVERIKKAASLGENVLIFGDYDVDGILSVVILLKALNSLGAKADYYIPARLKEGYGIKEHHINIALEKKANLVISVDCGIKAIKFAERAKEHGVDVIITDHHLPGDSLPDVLAILNPLISGSEYPDRNLAGIGVVYKLIQALFDEKRSLGLPHYLKLVSIGTIADVGALRGENRLFVKFGLRELENVSNKGLISLLEVCGLGRRGISVGDVGFRIGPRINAAGRMGMTDLAVRLFLSDDIQECSEIVQLLDSLNSKRQMIEGNIHKQALKQIEEKNLNKKYKLLIMGCEEWHRGVIGIVASRLKDIFHRPIILFFYKDGKAYGSGRSIADFSLISCLDESRSLLNNYGGHTLAIGCELDRENMESFKSTINAFTEARISVEQLRRKIHIDTKLDFDEINTGFLEKLSLLSPFGMRNPKPLFMTEAAEVITVPKKIQRKHCRFLARQKGRVFEALGWGRGSWAEDIQRGDRLDLVYSIQISEYRGEERMTLNMEDIKKI